jgi:hypothetical protein
MPQTNITNNVKNKSTRIVKYVPFTLKEFYDTEAGGKDYATLAWTIRMGYPRITVFTSNINLDGFRATDVDYSKMIIAPFDIVNFKTFIKLFKEIIVAGKPNVYKRIDCLNVKYVNNEKTNDVYVQGSVLFGLSKEGIPTLTVTEQNKLKVAFKIMPASRWHKYYDENGDLIEDPSKIAKIYALSYLEMLDESITADTLIDAKEITSIKEKPTTQVANNTATSNITMDQMDMIL